MFSKLVEAEAFENPCRPSTWVRSASPGGRRVLIPLLDAVLDKGR